MLRSLFRPSRDRQLTYALYASVVEQARQQIFYEDGLVADTLEGRFDMILIHLVLVLERLRAPDGTMTPEGQALFDLFLADMDRNLREIGVGDLSVPKKMKRIGESFYGRFGAYCDARDREAMAEAIGRNVFPGGDGAAANAAERLADYALRARTTLAAAPREQIVAGLLEWPDFRG